MLGLSTWRPVLTNRLGISFSVTLTIGRTQFIISHICWENLLVKRNEDKNENIPCLLTNMETKYPVLWTIWRVWDFTKALSKWTCTEIRNLTGQGSKVCPMSDQQLIESVHTSAGHEDITAQLHRDRQHWIDSASPSRDIFQKTSAFISALQYLRCRGPMNEPTLLSSGEKELCEILAQHKSKIQRGFSSQQQPCDGHLELCYGNVDAKLYIR